MTYNRVLNDNRKKLSRFFYNLIEAVDLPDQAHLQEEFIQRACEVRERIKPCTKYRNVNNLAPYVAYFFFKTRGIYMDQLKFLTFIHVSYYEFHKGLKQLISHFPKFIHRNRYEIIQNYIFQIWKKLGLKTEFLGLAMQFFKEWYHIFKSKREEFVAITFLSLAGILLDKEFKCFRFCCYVGVKHSSIYKYLQIMARYFQIEEFTTVAKSYSLLRNALCRELPPSIIQKGIINSLTSLKIDPEYV